MGVVAHTVISMTAEIVRCSWAGNDPEYQRYHDEEWGVADRDDRLLFEKIILEGFQAGLSWITILKKREGFRELFADFDAPTVAAFGEDDVERLMGDARIVRNRSKIRAAIANARIVADMAPGELTALLWSFAPAERPHPRPVSLADAPATIPEAEALSKELRRRGFRFVGPTTMYALMQAEGMVDDHLVGCFRVVEGS